MSNGRNQNVQNDEANTFDNNVKKIIDEMNNNTNHTIANKENNFTNVLTKIFYDSHCKEWYYFKRMNALSIMFFYMCCYDLKQHYVCRKECREMQTKLKRMQKKVQGLIKITIITIKIAMKILEMMQYNVLNGINTILNGFNIFLTEVKCYESGDITIILKYTNICKIDLNDEAQCIDATINGIITKNVDDILVIIVVDIITIFFNVTNRFKCGAIIPIVTSDNCFERDRNLEYVAKQAPASAAINFGKCFNCNLFEHRLQTSPLLFATLTFKNLNGYYDNVIAGLVTVKIKEESKREIVGDYRIIVQYYCLLNLLEIKDMNSFFRLNHILICCFVLNCFVSVLFSAGCDVFSFYCIL